MKAKEIKLNDYTLPERVKAKMILALFKTHQKQKELGFTFVQNQIILLWQKDILLGFLIE